MVLVSFRMQSHEPFTRLALIIGSVAAVSAGLLIFETRALRRRFHVVSDEALQP